VVATPDTGLGAHPWFADPAGATDTVTFNGLLLGIHSPSPTMRPAPPLTPNPLDPVLEPDTGHGTFIAGVVRQLCPEARILAIPVMRGDGVVTESVVMATLTLLLARHVQAQTHGPADELVDILSLSLGYYHENPEDAQSDGPLRDLMHAYGAHGVAVVAAAGNNTTLAPMFPAGFAGQPGALAPGAVPMAGVGALNASGATVAYYSNAGPWVSCYRPGSSLVSTFPIDATAAQQASARVEHHNLVRTTMDPDDYRSGFCTWSGTSFAAPVLAGQLAAHLAEDKTLADPSLEAAAPRIRRALVEEIPEWREQR
jgi:subtilisin family serine protease